MDKKQVGKVRNFEDETTLLISQRFSFYFWDD